MKFFIIRTEGPTGNPDFPLTMFAKDISQALKRLAVDSSTTAAVIIRERPMQDATLFKRDPANPDESLLEHPDVAWDSDFLR